MHDILRKLLSQEQSVGIDLKALGTDSFTYPRLVHRMRKEQGIKISVAEAMGAASNHTCRDDVTHDFDTLAQFGPVAQPATLPHTPPEVVLLTGATGLVGGTFLERIATTNPDAAVVCLIRAASDSEAQSRLTEVCTQRGFSLTNVTTIAGDVASPHLGVTPEIYSRLQRKVTWVVHAAALVNWVLPYSKMRSANVIGTHNVLKFVYGAHLGPDLMHISTQSVTGEASLQSVLRMKGRVMRRRRKWPSFSWRDLRWRVLWWHGVGLLDRIRCLVAVAEHSGFCAQILQELRHISAEDRWKHRD